MQLVKYIDRSISTIEIFPLPLYQSKQKKKNILALLTPLLGVNSCNLPIQRKIITHLKPYNKCLKGRILTNNEDGMMHDMFFFRS